MEMRQLPPIRKILFRVIRRLFVFGNKRTEGDPVDKVANAVLTNWVSFCGTPGIISAAEEPRFTGSEFRNFVMNKTLLYRRLSMGIFKV